MKEQVRECVEYFRVRPGYHRILIALRQKYERFGRAAGTVQLPDASNAECEAARLLFGRPFSAPVRFQASQFETALQQTRFQGVCPKEVLEAYFGVEIKTNREVQETQNRRLASILDQAAKNARSETSAQWVHALEERRGSGYSLLRREAAKDPESTQTDLLRACQSMDWLELQSKEPIRLAVLSAAATSDPHALDSGTRCGKLFQHLLSFRSGLSNPGTNVEQRDHLYYQNGILCDSISSLVTQIGLILSTETVEHPAYCLFRQRHEICTLSLANLAHVRGGGQSLRPGLYRRKRNGFFTALRPGRTVPFSADLYLRPALRSGCAAAGSSGCERDTAVLLGRLRRKGPVHHRTTVRTIPASAQTLAHGSRGLRTVPFG